MHDDHLLAVTEPTLLKQIALYVLVTIEYVVTLVHFIVNMLRITCNIFSYINDAAGNMIKQYDAANESRVRAVSSLLRATSAASVQLDNSILDHVRGLQISTTSSPAINGGLMPAERSPGDQDDSMAKLFDSRKVYMTSPKIPKVVATVPQPLIVVAERPGKKE